VLCHAGCALLSVGAVGIRRDFETACTILREKKPGRSPRRCPGDVLSDFPLRHYGHYGRKWLTSHVYAPMKCNSGAELTALNVWRFAGLGVGQCPDIPHQLGCWHVPKCLTSVFLNVNGYGDCFRSKAGPTAEVELGGLHSKKSVDRETTRGYKPAPANESPCTPRNPAPTRKASTTC
jgi:hypothetical protein